MKSCGAALLAATLMASATAQLTFSDDAGGESTAVAEVVQLEAGDDQSTGKMNQLLDSYRTRGCPLAWFYLVMERSSIRLPSIGS